MNPWIIICNNTLYVYAYCGSPQTKSLNRFYFGQILKIILSVDRVHYRFRSAYILTIWLNRCEWAAKKYSHKEVLKIHINKLFCYAENCSTSKIHCMWIKCRKFFYRQLSLKCEDIIGINWQKENLTNKKRKKLEEEKTNLGTTVEW